MLLDASFTRAGSINYKFFGLTKNIADCTYVPENREANHLAIVHVCTRGHRFQTWKIYLQAGKNEYLEG